MITINGKPINAKEFGFDNCHKIYLINNEEDRITLKELSYDIFPIKELKKCYENACPLKFIYNADLTTVVEQCEKAIIKEVKCKTQDTEM